MFTPNLCVQCLCLVVKSICTDALGFVQSLFRNIRVCIVVFGDLRIVSLSEELYLCFICTHTFNLACACVLDMLRMVRLTNSFLNLLWIVEITCYKGHDLVVPSYCVKHNW